MKSNFSIGVLATAFALVLAGSAAAQRPYSPSRAWQVRGVIDRTERESNALRASFERDFRRYDLDRLPRFDAAKRDIQRMDEAFERLRAVADDRKPRAGVRELQTTIERARTVDRLFVRNPNIRDTVRYQWRDLRGDINNLARIYDVPGLGDASTKRRRRF